jgi:hypothetical protein
MSIRVLWLFKLAILFFSAKTKVVFVQENFLIFLVSEFASETLEKWVVGELKGLLDYLFGNLTLCHSS